MPASLTTRVLTVDPEAPDVENIRVAAAALRAGQLVAFPTETVYGLGANALDQDAIQRIYDAKQRPANDPIIAHITQHSQLDALAVDVPQAAYALAAAFWPGPLTLVLRRAPSIPANIATGRQTIAVRMPANPVAYALIEAAGVPVAAPSANTFTRPSATTAEHVLHDLGGRVEIVLDGGPTHIGLESTVIDMTGAVPVVLRPGGVTMDDIQSIIPEAAYAPGYSKSDEANVAPGQMLKHYSPNAHMMLFMGPLYSVLIAMREAAREHQAAGRQVGLLLADEDYHHLRDAGTIVTLGRRDDLKAISHNLFAGMRDLDTQQVDVILARDFGRNGLGAALWDRLLRAAEGHVVEVS
ncbi:MAG: L-threonylcarbamoyladenylate synthase [Chloroflexota bacterium]